jgi:hypothetical protein
MRRTAHIGVQAIQLSPYHAGPPAHRHGHLDPAAGFLACSCPWFTFRLQVSHQTQEPPFEFLPAEPGIQPRRLVAHWNRSTFPVVVGVRGLVLRATMPFSRQIRSNSTSTGRGCWNRPVNCLPLSS